MPFRPLFLFLLATLGLVAVPKGVADDESALAGLTWRNIGPAFMSGRIADIAWHPARPECLVSRCGVGWRMENQQCWRDVETDL